MREPHSDLPLFTWQPPCKLIVFPMTSRVGKIRDTARKLLDKSTGRHAEWYRRTVTDSLINHLDKLGVPEAEQDEHIGAFWSRVEEEVVRQTYRSSGNSDPRGAA